MSAAARAAPRREVYQNYTHHRFRLASGAEFGTNSLETAAILPVGLHQGIAEFFHDSRPNYSNRRGVLGMVWSLPSHWRLDTRYGFGRDSDGTSWHVPQAEAIRVIGKTEAMLLYRVMALTPPADNTVHMVSPGAVFYPIARFWFLARYYFTKDTRGATGHSGWIQANWEPHARWIFRLGGTYGETGGDELFLSKSEIGRSYSWQAGLGFRPLRRPGVLEIRFDAERYLKREGYREDRFLFQIRVRP